MPTARNVEVRALPTIPQIQAALGRGGFALAVVVVVAVLLVVIAAARRNGARRTATVVAGAGLLVSVLGVLSLTLPGWIPPGQAPAQLFLDPVEGAWGWDSIAWRPVLDNVLLFVPVGAFAAATAWRRPTLVVWLGGVTLSVAVEVIQFVAATGRVANSADVLANAIGALVGVLLAVVLGTRVPSASVTPWRPLEGTRTSS